MRNDTLVQLDLNAQKLLSFFLFERIDWEEDCLLPEITALKSGKSVLGLGEGMAFDIRVEPNDRHSDE